MGFAKNNFKNERQKPSAVAAANHMQRLHNSQSPELDSQLVATSTQLGQLILQVDARQQLMFSGSACLESDSRVSGIGSTTVASAAGQNLEPKPWQPASTLKSYSLGTTQ